MAYHVFAGLFLLLFSLLTGPTAGLAQETGQVMVFPVETRDMEQEVAPAEFTGLVRDYFASRDNIVMLTEDQLESLLGTATGTRSELIKVAGEKLNCRAALLITLERYRERLGDEYSATDPASLAFEYRLVDAADGRVLCFGQFDETQEPVSENILEIDKAFKRGFKWISVADLAREGLRKKFSACEPLATTVP